MYISETKTYLFVTGLLLSITYSKEIITKIFQYITWGEYMLYCIEIVFIFNTIIMFIKSLVEMKQIMDAKVTSKSELDQDIINKRTTKRTIMV